MKPEAVQLSDTSLSSARPRSNSSSASVSLGGKIVYNAQLLRIRMAGQGDVAANILADVRTAAADFERRTGRLAADSTLIEIGFGARPFRAFAFSCIFKQVIAIDLDKPVFGFTDLPRVFARNGLERGIKSFARHLLFDSREWRRFHRSLKAAYPEYSRDKVRFVIGSAGDEAVWRRIAVQPDYVFSSDVFEHIPPAELQTLMTTLRGHLAPGGLLVTRPNVFTGIAGGHDIAWYSHRVDKNESGTAWGHLLDPDFRVNTYVNRLRRADYATLFRETGFKILEDRTMQGRLGEQHLNDARRAELHDYDEYELFSNRVEFVLQ